MDLAGDYASAGFLGRLGFGVRPAVVVVDVVRAYLVPGSPLADDAGRFESARASAARVVAVARGAGHPVVFTCVRLMAGRADAGLFGRKVPGLAVFEEGSPLAGFADEPAPAAGEVVVAKQYASAFFGTSLASTLTSWNIDTVVIVGFSTSGCVRATALDALQHGFRPIVVAEACGDRAAGPHEQNLFDLDAKYADVLGEREVLDHFVTHPGGAAP